ncbi:MAG TPA: citrate/2-methylcitrate synthase [Clostridiales bacterium]|jgi:citrate synthase|nr:citrate/2-methylcitrate synthase [Clostridiales bacterium]
MQENKTNNNNGKGYFDKKESLPVSSTVTDEIRALSELCYQNGTICSELYEKHKVNRGLRDLAGNGVLTGLTDISEVRGFENREGQKIPGDGRLFYRGYDIRDLVRGFVEDGRFGFEETTYLLIFGQLPTASELEDFQALLSSYRTLPPGFARDIIMKAPTLDMMNTLARSVLTLHSYDHAANEIDIPNVLRQCLFLTAVFPLLSIYGYWTYKHYYEGESLIIHVPKKNLSTAENILHMLRPDSRYSPLEAALLDLALVLHAEHGGGNNSTFTTRVVSSSGTDTYSAIAAALGSLKGPKHGGANLKVVQMFEDMKQTVDDWEDEQQISVYLYDLLEKKAFDREGLIYGMGHAIYSLSDPRAEIFRSFVEDLAEEKGRMKEYRLYSTVERLAKQIIQKERKIYKGVSANVDFYSGFVYSMLNLPLELYTPIFAIARISGWSAHRIEELINASKIIRPAYMSVAANRPYVSMAER